MIYELPEYYVLSGKWVAWIEFMEKTMLPYQRTKGIKIIACYWPS